MTEQKGGRKMHRKRQLLAMAVGVAVLSGASSSNSEPGSGIRMDGWTISPFAGLSAMYDSNVLLAERNEDSDTFLEGIVGLDVSHKVDWLTLEFQLSVMRRAYMDLNELDYTSFGDNIRVRYNSPGGIYINADQRFRRVEDRDLSGYTSNPNDASSAAAAASLLTAAERTRRDLHNVGVTVGRDVTDKITANATYAFAIMNYDASGLFDSVEHVAVVEGGYKITDKTVAILDLQCGIEDSDAFDKNTQFAAVRAGATSRGTDKIQYKVGLGWQTYMRPEGAGDDVNALSANLTARWQATDKVSIEAGGRNDILASSLYRENVRTVSSAWLGAVYQPIATVQTQVSVSYGQEKHSDPVDVGGEMETRKDDVLDLEARVAYTPPAKFMSVFLLVNYATVDSNVAGYDELRAGGGVSVKY